MRWVLFTEVQIHQTKEEQMQVIEIPRYVNADRVDGVTPGVVPSEVAGPMGEAVAKPAAYIHTGIEHILVKCTINEALYMLTWEGIDVEGPKGCVPGEYITTSIMKRSMPESGSENESKIIS